MNCPSCHHKNRAGAYYCEACGAQLTRTCAFCGTELSAAARFCNGCGRPVGEAGPAGQRAPSAPLEEPAEAIGATHEATAVERKQVTVMFVDIVGSMDLAETLDSERWRGLLDRFFALASDSVHSVQGTIDKFTGDGVMALFGAPTSYEDHARRACLAALHLHASLAPLAADLADDGVAFAIRVGLNSGEVIVGGIGDEGQMDYTAIGHTVGLAQRMQSLAPAGSTALSAATGALVTGEFDLDELGEFEVKGSSVPQRVFELVGKAPSRDRVEAAGARGGLSPFVGRERELAEIEAALDRATAGDGQVVALVGEPGVGKSRLAYEFIERCLTEGISVQRARALAHGRDVPLLPVLELMRSTLGVGDTDEAAVARERIAESLQALDASFQEDLPLLFDFLGVADPEHPAPKIEPEARQCRLLSLVRRMVHARSRVQTAVILIEDLHWLDDASTVFLAEFVRACVGTRTLLILTYRPEYAAEVLRGSHCEQLALRPLARSAVGELLRSLLGDDRSLDGLSDLIAARAVGNPFFCEELVAALAESGHLVGERGAYRLGRTLQEVVLPPTVQATLAARIDGLKEREKELLQTASVIGYQVSEPLLRAVCGLPDRELSGALDSLVSAELLSERMGERGVEYLFKHPLTHEVAYRSQLSDRRRQVHAATGEALEHLYDVAAGEGLAEVAYHFLEAAPAGNSKKAVAYARRAAERAVGTFAYDEAVTLYGRALDLVDGARAPERLELLQALGEAQMRAGDAEAARATLLRAAEVARARGDPDALARAALACNIWALSSGIDEPLVHLAEEAVEELEGAGSPGLLASAKGLLAAALYWSDQVERRERLAADALELARAEHERLRTKDSAHVLAYVVGRYLLTRWGPDSASRDYALSEELLVLSHETRDSELEILARNWRIAVLLEIGDFSAVDREIARVEQMATELRQPRAMVFLPLHHATRAVTAGRFAEAERLNVESMDTGRRVRGTVGELAAGAQLVTIRLQEGRLAELEPAIRTVVNLHPGMVAFQCALALSLIHGGRRAEARAELERLMGSGVEGLPRDNTHIVILAVLGEVAAELEDEARARDLYSWLEPYGGRWVVSPGAAALWPVHRSLGRLATVAGWLDVALGHIGRAREQAARAGAAPSTALVALDEARLLATRGRPEDRARVCLLAREARELARDLGMGLVVDAATPLEDAATPLEGAAAEGDRPD